MSTSIIKIKNLTMKYKDRYALDSISLSIEKGKIYGLIGQNGAGKTTLMRILTGAIFPTSGEILVLNKEQSKYKSATKSELEELRKRMGSIVEFPALYPAMSAKDNMKVHARVCNCNANVLIDELLTKAGLGNVGKKKVQNFSLGMKQRLGIAKALLNSPELLILDEPINGLDPIGIIEIRNLLKQLNEEQNITMIISSHILSEVYQIATDYIFIDNGRIIETITQEVLQSRIDKEGKDLESYYVELLSMNAISN